MKKQQKGEAILNLMKQSSFLLKSVVLFCLSEKATRVWNIWSHGKIIYGCFHKEATASHHPLRHFCFSAVFLSSDRTLTRVVMHSLAERASDCLYQCMEVLLDFDFLSPLYPEKLVNPQDICDLGSAVGSSQVGCERCGSNPESYSSESNTVNLPSPSWRQRSSICEKILLHRQCPGLSEEK